MNRNEMKKNMVSLKDSWSSFDQRQRMLNEAAGAETVERAH